MSSLPLNTISNSHIKNSGDLLNNINMVNKSIARQDIKSLHTNILIHKYIKRFEIRLKKTTV